MICINPSIRDQLHEDSKKHDIDRHWPGILQFKILDRVYRDNFCPICAYEYKDQIHKFYEYDYRTDSAIKKD